jgi:type IV secretion system protein VirD4
LLEDLPRGVRGREPTKQRMPASAWLDPDALAGSDLLKFDRSKLFLGVVHGQVRKLGADRFTTGGTAVGLGDDRHAVLVAGSRAGKGRSCLIPTLLEYGGSVLALDPKGELANITARRRSAIGQRVCIVDPFGITAPRLAAQKVGFNPLSLLTLESPTLIADAGLIADAIVVASDKADPHWDESARNFVEGVILHVATYEAYEGTRTLVTVREVIKKAFDRVEDLPDDFEGEAPHRLRVELNHNAAILEETNPGLASSIEGTARDFFDKGDRERSSVLSVALRNTKFLDYPELRENLSQHGFDLTDLKTDESGLTVYLCLPAGRMATCNRWFRLFVNLAIEAMERTRKVRPKIPVLAMLEEFHVLGFMQQIEVAAGLVAGFGMKLWIVLQDLTQLKRHYKDGWETFLGNAGVMVFFGNSDMTTLDYISKRCGQTSLIVERKNDVTTSQRTSGSTGASWSLEVRELLTPEEASRFFGRDDDQQRQLVIRPGLPPAIMQRAKYDKHEMFEGKFDSVD